MKSVARRLKTHKFHFGKLPPPEIIIEWWTEYSYSKPSEKGSDEEVAVKVYDEDCKDREIIAEQRRAATEAQMRGLGSSLPGFGLGGLTGSALLQQQAMAGYKHYCPYCRGL